jgi:hypothetical protein
MKRRTASPADPIAAAPIDCGAIADRYDAKMLRCWCGLFWEIGDETPCPLADGAVHARPRDYDKTAFTRKV